MAARISPLAMHVHHAGAGHRHGRRLHAVAVPPVTPVPAAPTPPAAPAVPVVPAAPVAAVGLAAGTAVGQLVHVDRSIFGATATMTVSPIVARVVVGEAASAQAAVALAQQYSATHGGEPLAIVAVNGIAGGSYYVAVLDPAVSPARAIEVFHAVSATVPHIVALVSDTQLQVVPDRALDLQAGPVAAPVVAPAPVVTPPVAPVPVVTPPATPAPVTPPAATTPPVTPPATTPPPVTPPVVAPAAATTPVKVVPAPALPAAARHAAAVRHAAAARHRR